MPKVAKTGPHGTRPGDRSVPRASGQSLPQARGPWPTGSFGPVVSTTYPLAKPRAIRSTSLSPERCVAILGTLQKISTASADVDGCGLLLEIISEELQAEQAALILCNPLTRKLEFIVHNQDPAFPKLYADYYCDLDPTHLSDYIKGYWSGPQNQYPQQEMRPLYAFSTQVLVGRTRCYLRSLIPRMRLLSIPNGVDMTMEAVPGIWAMEPRWLDSPHTATWLRF